VFGVHETVQKWLDATLAVPTKRNCVSTDRRARSLELVDGVRERSAYVDELSKDGRDIAERLALASVCKQCLHIVVREAQEKQALENDRQAVSHGTLINERTNE